MLLVLALRILGWKGVPIGLAVIICLAATAWFTSPYLRGRIFHGVWEFNRYENLDQGTSIGARLEFWRRSLIFVAEAPIIGHGTGSIRSLFAESATGKEWIGTSHAVGTHVATALVTPNPHNQTFAVAIQLGLVGVGVMYAMWLAHLLCFIRSGLFESFGIIVMIQMIVGCAFNSHLFDFTEGWFYVVAVSGLIGAASNHDGGRPLTNRLRQLEGEDGAAPSADRPFSARVK
jgi:O-antigen ligase